MGLVNKILTNIQKLFGKFNNVITRKDLREELTDSLGTLSGSLDQQISDMKEIIRAVNLSVNDDKLTKEIVHLAKLKATTINDFLGIIKNIKDGILAHGDDIKELVNTLPASLVEESLSPKQLATIKLVNNISGFVDYLGDYLFHLHATVTGAEDEILVKNINKRLEERKIFFYIVIKEFTVIDEVIKNIQKLSDEPINLKTESGISYITTANDGVVSGFAGNPIYFIGKVISDLKIARAERLEERAKIYRLTLGKLKAEKEAGEEVPNYDKQLKYYTEKLESVERKIEKLKS